ncbi:LolA family protein [Pseudoroseicyclus sp. H15]
MDKTRRTLMMAPLALALLPGAAFAQQLSLGEISSYLNALQTAQGGFTQINADGTISTGTIYIKRPGRVRFEYDPPEQSLVMAGGGAVAIFDARSNQNPERYPLSQTPLSIILAANVDFTRANMVTGHTSDGTTTTVTAQDPEHPDYGSIQMVYSSNPVELRQWIVTDNAGEQTTVILNNLQSGGAISDVLFNIRRETDNWN